MFSEIKKWLGSRHRKSTIISAGDPDDAISEIESLLTRNDGVKALAACESALRDPRLTVSQRGSFFLLRGATKAMSQDHVGAVHDFYRIMSEATHQADLRIRAYHNYLGVIRSLAGGFSNMIVSMEGAEDAHKASVAKLFAGHFNIFERKFCLAGYMLGSILRDHEVASHVRDSCIESYKLLIHHMTSVLREGGFTKERVRLLKLKRAFVLMIPDDAGRYIDTSISALADIQIVLDDPGASSQLKEIASSLATRSPGPEVFTFLVQDEKQVSPPTELPKPLELFANPFPSFFRPGG